MRFAIWKAGFSPVRRRPDMRRQAMAEAEWGKCKDCKWFQIEPDARAANNTMGLCIEEGLQRFRLRVSGNSGCNAFMAGKGAPPERSIWGRPRARRRDDSNVTERPRLVWGFLVHERRGCHD